MNHFEIIERRLNGEMSPAEEQAFDQRLQVDEGLADEFRLQLEEQTFFEHLLEEKIQERIAHVQRSMEREENQSLPWVSQHRHPILLTVAASILILLSFLLFLPHGDIIPNYLQIAEASYEKSPPNFSQTRGHSSISQQADLQQLLALLDSKDQSEVQEAVRLLESQQKADANLHYYLGHGYWKLGEYTTSVAQFKQFLGKTSTNDSLYPYCEFYLLHALVATEALEEFKQFASQIQNGHIFEKEINQLLDQIK